MAVRKDAFCGQLSFAYWLPDPPVTRVLVPHDIADPRRGFTRSDGAEATLPFMALTSMERRRPRAKRQNLDRELRLGTLWS